MSTLKIGIAGVGSMGFNHCKVVQKMKNIQFIGVYDIDRNRSLQISKTFSVPFFLSYDDLINAADAVIIAVPTSLHYSLTRRAIEKGKHVLVEKPFVSSMDEAKQIVKMAEEASVIVQVGHIERFNPAFIWLSDNINPQDMISIEARRLGVPNRYIDTDVILDVMIHDIDIMMQLMNSPLSSVSGVGYYKENNKQLEAASALLSFQNGCFASLLSSRLALEKKRSIYVTEKTRFLKSNLLTKEITIHHKTLPTQDNILPPQHSHIIENVSISNTEPLYEEIKHFLHSIQSMQSPMAGVQEAAKVLEVALKIKEQIENNQ
ncbi:hypothetical protein CVD28_11185 [Bacillus sp. M6-12]|uniref:Gfo/Idh/MocA family protein n=1 Tax=Bacillus sp. M6-12 TaxID=2054166 RepID=UPI000C755C79|nr:Gfo/Idh/MocA family oxidoreductase [Bacillus sp. M6-12]PLS17556.1 hypothetical protein CVD28_11185 [Bacillus sp. M6-12]